MSAAKLFRHLAACNKHNDHSLNVYRHFGFQTIDAQKNDIGNGFFMDDYIMEYRL
mgnify:CR=1 FL=1